MAEGKFFANWATITCNGQAVGVAKGCEVTVEFEHVELYGLGSILRQGVSKHTAKVPVTISSAKFDPTLATGIAQTYGVVLKGATGSTTSATITDTNQVALFTIDGKFTADDGTTKLRLQVTGVYFESLPFAFTENEYVTFELSGVGSGITISNTHT
jgi:hypothetical protein